MGRMRVAEALRAEGWEWILAEAMAESLERGLVCTGNLITGWW